MFDFGGQFDAANGLELELEIADQIANGDAGWVAQERQHDLATQRV